MSILLYHGSNQYFEQVDLKTASMRGFLDFGRGFYLTTYFEQAESWAFRKISFSDVSARAYVYEYRFDSEYLEELNVLKFLKYDNKWFDFVIEARGKEDMGTEYDLIYDRMADGNLSTIITQFKKGEICRQVALKKLCFKSSSRDQYCFKSLKAVNMLHRIRYAEVGRTSNKGTIVKWHKVGGNEND